MKQSVLVYFSPFVGSEFINRTLFFHLLLPASGEGLSFSLLPRSRQLSLSQCGIGTCYICVEVTVSETGRVETVRGLGSLFNENETKRGIDGEIVWYMTKGL